MGIAAGPPRLPRRSSGVSDVLVAALTPAVAEETLDIVLRHLVDGVPSIVPGARGAGVVAAILTFPTIIWFDSTNPQWWPVVQSLFTVERLNTNVGDFFRMWGRIIGLHIGLVVLAALASG